jgi:ankyrin repeat protein
MVCLGAVFMMPGCGSEIKEDPLFQPAYDVYQAAEAGDVESIQFFVSDYSWDPMVASSEGLTPLCAAAKGGNVDVITLMVEAGADVNYADSHGKKPLAYAKEAGKQEAVDLLLQLGATE